MLGFLGQFKSTVRQPGEEVTEKPPETQKSSSADEFLATPAVKDFVARWAEREKDGVQLYKKRGITRLLRTIFPSFSSDKEALKEADHLLKMLGGMDKLEGFLAGWKAKSEGIVKGLKSILGGKG